MGFISIRVADFAAGSPDLTHPPPLPGLGSSLVPDSKIKKVLQTGGTTYLTMLMIIAVRECKSYSI
jgi:hypothetical protein